MFSYQDTSKNQLNGLSSYVGLHLNLIVILSEKRKEKLQNQTQTKSVGTTM